MGQERDLEYMVVRVGYNHHFSFAALLQKTADFSPYVQ